jgi:hypothetical protein
MKLIAINTINLGGGKSAAPGGEFEIADTKGAEALIEAGAATRKTKLVADDSDNAATGDPAADPSLPASGSTQAPDPDAVAAANKSAKRTS